jgi:hypothetical protein
MFGYRIRIVLAALWSWLPVVNAWVLVSKDGDITLLGPIDIDPSYSQAPRVTFRVRGTREWDIQIADLTKNLVFSSVDGVGVNRHHGDYERLQGLRKWSSLRP